MATVREIAQLAGVSPSTVSRVLTASTPVSAATRRKVQEAVDTLAKAISQENVSFDHSVGIIMPASTASDPTGHPSLFTIITAFVETLSSMGVSNTTLVYDEKLNSPAALLSPKLDGYMIIGTSSVQEEQLLPVLSQMDVPHIIINRHAVNNRLVSICFDDDDAACNAVEHLISLGHRQIVYVGGNEDYQNSRRRLAGYRRALEKHGIDYDSRYFLSGKYSETSGYQMGKLMLTLDPRPTAAFFASDALAVGCMRCMAEHGIRIPQDLAMIGFGNAEVCEYVLPSLSTVSQPSRNVGIVAAKMLAQMWQTPEIAHSEICMKTELILRESSGGPTTKKN